jgi:hypothetical protein
LDKKPVICSSNERETMRILVGLMLVVLVAALAITGVVYVLARLFLPLGSGTDSQAWKKLLKKLNDHLDKHYGNLVPWDEDMLGLLSLNQQEERKPGFFNTIRSGVYSSIYHEPVLAYAMLTSGQHAVTLARTADRAFIFRKKAKETEIWINKEPFGLYIDGSLISAGRGGRMIGRLERRPEESAFPVVLGDAASATLSNPSVVRSPNPRAVTMLKDMSPDEQNALLAMAILNMTGQA